MGITLPADLQSFVDQLVASGSYSSPEAVVREAMERLRNDQSRFQELKATFDEATAELERGEGKPLDFAEIKRKIREQAKQREQAALRGTA
jgi:putative addiction module CopG family antidote